jgi:hypothetical protein
MEARNPDPNSRTLLSSEWGYFSYRPAKARFIPTPLWCDLTPVQWLTRKLELNLHMQTATWLVKRELTVAAGPWNTRLLGDDDGEYFCRVLLASDGVRFVPGSKVYYRISGQSRLSYIGRSNKKMDAQFASMQLTIRYLRSLEESPRVKSTCVRYLQNWSIHFFPARMDLFNAAQALAADLGGRLEPPRLSWKYAWIKSLFGWNAAREAQLRYNEIKFGLLRSWDKALFRLERAKTSR